MLFVTNGLILVNSCTVDLSICECVFLEVDSLTIKWAAVALATYYLLDSRERDRHKTETFNMPFAETASKPLERTDDVQHHHTSRAAQHTRRRQRRTVLPQAVPHRRQKRCKLFLTQSVSDPKVHLAPWHNDRPFVLGLYDRRIKKCWGCHTTFGVDEIFVIHHQELREFWKKDVGRIMASTTSLYHCNMSCISPRHPYFHIRSLILSPGTLHKLTDDDVRAIRDSVVRHLVGGLDQ